MTGQLFAVAGPDKIDVFTKSRTSRIDLEISLPMQGGQSFEALINGVVSNLHHTSPYAWRELQYMDPVRRSVWFKVSQPEVRLYALVSSDAPGKDPLGKECTAPVCDAATGFLIRYQSYRRCMLEGDYLAVADMVAHSEKLKPYVDLLKALEEPFVQLPLAMRFLHDSDSTRDQVLSAMASRRPDRLPSSYRLLFSDSTLVNSFASCDDFGLHIKHVVLGRLATGSLRIPVAGLQFHQHALAIYIDQVRMVLQELLRVHASANGSRQWNPESLVVVLGTLLPLSVGHEPYNTHDVHAMAVLVRTLDGKQLHLGYVRRPLAELLHESGWEFDASLALVDDDELEIDIRRIL